MKKGEGKEKLLTLIDTASARFEKISQERDKVNAPAREEIKQLGAERASIQAKRDELNGRVAGMTAEYRQVLAEMSAEEAKRITEANITEQDLEAGRISAVEFLRFGKKAHEVQAGAWLIAGEKIGKVRDTIRSLRGQVYELDAQLADLNERIGYAFRQIGGLFYFQIEAIRRELLNAGVGGVGAQILRFAKQEVDNDLGMAAKGGSIFHCKMWKFKDIEEAELVILDPILQQAHFEKLRQFIELNIRGRAFTEVTVGYSPGDAFGHLAGDFWLLSMRTK